MHVDDDAEAYALGLLDAPERERVDAHVATCEACLRRLGAAEAGVATLVDATASAPVRRTPWLFAAVAGIGLALAAAIVTALGLQSALAGDGRLIALMSTSHFSHVQFHTAAGAPLDVKAVYERHGAWFGVIANGTTSARVTLVEPDGTRVKIDQRFARRGDASYLLIDAPPPLVRLELDDPGGAVIGTAEPLVTR